MPATLTVRSDQSLVNMTTQELRDARSSAWAVAQEFDARAEDDASLSKREHETWTQALDLVDKIGTELETRENLQRGASLRQPSGPVGVHDRNRQGTAGVPAPPGGSTSTEERQSAVMPELLTRSDSLAEQWRSRPGYRSEHDDLSLTKIVRGVTTGRWDGAEAEQRAMSESIGAAGGFVVPETLSSQIIDLARKKSRCIEAGASTVTMDNPTLKVPMLAEDLEGQWHGEGELIADDQPAFSMVQLQSKTYASMTLVSRELFEDTASTVTDAVRTSASASMALGFDYAGLYGDGGPKMPLGLVNWGAGGAYEVHKTTLGSGNGATPADYDHLVDGIGELWDRNHEPTGMILAPRTELTYAKFKDQQDQPLQAPDVVKSVPRFQTNQVPKDLTVGSSNDCSDIIVGDWRHLVFGVRKQPMIMTLVERYADYGMIGILLWFRGDTAVLRPDAFEIIRGVRG